MILVDVLLTHFQRIMHHTVLCTFAGYRVAILLENKNRR